MAELEDLLEIIIFLTEMKGKYLTGQNIVVDGGLSLK